MLREINRTEEVDNHKIISSSTAWMALAKNLEERKVGRVGLLFVINQRPEISKALNDFINRKESQISSRLWINELTSSLGFFELVNYLDQRFIDKRDNYKLAESFFNVFFKGPKYKNYESFLSARSRFQSKQIRLKRKIYPPSPV